MDLTDASADAGDAALDQGDMQAADMRMNMPMDAGVDAGPAACQGDPCILAVDLAQCEACPIALPAGWVDQQRCVVPFDLVTPLFEYVPFDCTRACPQDTLQLCNAPVGVPQCGMDGICRVVSD
jgi:hypothetical protein